jgi:putative transcriptional regulator
MTKTAFEKIAAGLNDSIAFARDEADLETYRVHVPKSVDVRSIRQKMRLTQEQFAKRFGFSRGAVRDWEQNRRTPEASARILLTVIEREPDAVERALARK